MVGHSGYSAAGGPRLLGCPPPQVDGICGFHVCAFIHHILNLIGVAAGRIQEDGIEEEVWGVDIAPGDG